MRELNLFVFIALMGTSTLALSTKMFFNNVFSNIFAYILEIGIVLIFSFYFIIFISELLNFKKFSNKLKNINISNLYSTISISSSLISMMLIKIGFPIYNIQLSFIFWLIGFILSLYFIVAIPINLKFRTKIEDVLGTWFIPPVGLFVLISAGALLGNFIFEKFFIFVNLLIFGPAFVLYFLTLTLLYFRSKFTEPPKKNLIPSFNIVLAPAGVSIMAVLFTSKIMVNFYGLGSLFSGFAKIYSLIMLGYGLWVIFGLIFLYRRVLNEIGKIPFSSVWWAFIFPIGAFSLASFNIYLVFKILFFKVVYMSLYTALLFLWLYVLYKEIKNKK